MSYIDTSIIVAYYCPEPLSAAAEAFLRADVAPSISPLVQVEFCSALAIKTRTRELSRDAARRILSLFLSHLADGAYGMIPIDAREYLLARDWIASFSTPLRTLDALHLAAAFTNDLPLVTADKTLASASAALGVRHQLLS